MAERNCTPSDNKHLQHSSVANTIMDELLTMYQTSLDQCSAVQKQVKPLEVQLAASLQAKDYLTKKLQQVSGERDNFERQLSMYRHDRIDTPTSPESHPYSDYFSINAAEVQQSEPKRRNTLGLVGGASRHQETTSTLSDDHVRMEKQLMDYITTSERETQKMIQSYMNELETQRLETRMLRDVIDKQDTLIHVLESMVKTPNRQGNEALARCATKKRKAYSVNAGDELLKAQVELQRIELEDKQQLLSMLLHEREDLMKKVHQKDNQREKHNLTTTRPALRRKRSLSHPVGRSSIEILATIAMPSPEKDNKRSTSPPTGPPRDPLPPVPSVPSVPSRRSSPLVPDMSYSPSPSSSFTSLSTEFGNEGQHHQIRCKRDSEPRGITVDLPCEPEKTWKCAGTTNPRRRSIKKFWKGWKHMFGAS
ncbi:hypothetical protein DFQ28_000268 [Apophysomyces sp. BC1034]|nr:hypothetical protein DFQ30_001103 [Apophysomyces sp. BC1015]KAG0184021.1 hypothetical protein DFQ28_000268 [Apophysomyces sp. BC1034]